MRFERFGQHDFQDTQRKRMALQRKQAKERAAYPLFADDIQAEQQSVDQVMADRAQLWATQFARERASACKKWLAARRLLRSYTATEQDAISRFWQNCSWPGTPTYLLSMLNMYDTGRLEDVYGMMGLLGPVRPGDNLVAASIENPIRTIAGSTYWPAPPASAVALRRFAKRDLPLPTQLTL